MDNLPIDLIVGLIIAVAAAISKKSAKAKTGDPAKSMPDTTPSGQPILTEADRHYREVQEEIRRRIAQRNQTAPGQPATMMPSPMQDYRPSRKTTQPIGGGWTQPRRKAAPPPTLAAQPADPPPMPPMMADAPAMAAAPAYPSEAAAYALPKASGDNAASSGASPGGSNALRAILASPGAARQAYLLREIFGQPLSLRPMISGGLEDWN